MKWARGLVVGLISLSLIPGRTGEDCRPHIKGGCVHGWRQWGDFCYKATELQFMDWLDAKQECIRMGGVMAAPQSDQEYAFLLTLRPKFWIDCNYRVQDAEWVCEGDTVAHKYRDWALGEPDNMDHEHCVVARDSYAKWNNARCRLNTNNRRPTICKQHTAPTLYF